MNNEKTPAVLFRILNENSFKLPYTEEEVKTWRQKRKQNYPTTSNVKTKKARKDKQISLGDAFIPERLSRKIYKYPIEVDTDTNRQLHLRRTRAVNQTTWINYRLRNKSEVVSLETYFAHVQVDSDGVVHRYKNTIWDPVMTNEVEEDMPASLLSPNSNHLDLGKELSDSISITDDEDDELLKGEHGKSGNNTMEIETVESVQQESKLPLELSQLSVITPVNADMTSTGNSLRSLVAYGASDTDPDLEDGEIDDDEQPECLPILRQSSPPQNESHQNNISIPSTHQTTTSTTPGRHSQRKKRRRGHNRDIPKNTPPKKTYMKKSDREPTLLRRLLDDEICEERNAVLRAGHFLIQMNFFKGMENSVDVQQEFLDVLRSSDSLNDN